MRINVGELVGGIVIALVGVTLCVVLWSVGNAASAAAALDAAYYKTNNIQVFTERGFYTGCKLDETPTQYILTTSKGDVYRIDRPAVVHVKTEPK